jgi:SAM-dependent methyltransferase
MATAHDEETIAFYDREAAVYAARRQARRHPRLDAFIQHVGAGGKALELGCGGGQDAEIMLAAGLDVTLTDASTGLAAEAERRLGRPVRIMRFDELDETDLYQGVWANACLLHVPSAAMPDVLGRIWRALKPGGALYASFKAGAGDDRDRLGRFYNFPTRAALEGFFAASASWARLTITDDESGGGYDGVPRAWLLAAAVK